MHVTAQHSVVDLLRSWPRSAKLAACSLSFPTVGFLVGVVLSTLFMNLTEAFTVQGLIAFALPFAISTWIALACSRSWIAWFGAVPPAAILVLVCLANHATGAQLAMVWPILFQAIVGPAVGVIAAQRTYRSWCVAA